MSRYTAEQRAQALWLYSQVGPAEAARQTGVNPGTLRSWAHRTGAATVAPEELRNRTGHARARAHATHADFKADMIEQLSTVASVAVRREIELVTSDSATLRDIVGARTRAIHDLQLLAGDPTQRTETRTSTDLDAEIEQLVARLDRSDVDR